MQQNITIVTTGFDGSYTIAGVNGSNLYYSALELAKQPSDPTLYEEYKECERSEILNPWGGFGSFTPPAKPFKAHVEWLNLGIRYRDHLCNDEDHICDDEVHGHWLLVLKGYYFKQIWEMIKTSKWWETSTYGITGITGADLIDRGVIIFKCHGYNSLRKPSFSYNSKCIINKLGLTKYNTMYNMIRYRTVKNYCSALPKTYLYTTIIDKEWCKRKKPRKKQAKKKKLRRNH